MGSAHTMLLPDRILVRWHYSWSFFDDLGRRKEVGGGETCLVQQSASHDMVLGRAADLGEGYIHLDSVKAEGQLAVRSRHECVMVGDQREERNYLVDAMVEDLTERHIGRGLEVDQMAHCRPLESGERVADLTEAHNCPASYSR